MITGLAEPAGYGAWSDHVLCSFDTALPKGRRDLLRPKAFRTLWSQIDDAITARQIGFVGEVQR